MAKLPDNRPLPGMKPMNAYTFKQLRYRKLMKLTYNQVGLIQPAWKVYYLWDLAKPESKRFMEWYTTPMSVLHSPQATPAMKEEARKLEYTPADQTKRPKRKPEEMPRPGKVDPVQPIEEDWI